MKVLKSSLSSVRKDRKVTVRPPNRDPLGCVPGVVIMIFFACELSLATETLNLERLRAEVSADDARTDLNDVLNFNLVVQANTIGETALGSPKTHSARRRGYDSRLTPRKRRGDPQARGQLPASCVGSRAPSAGTRKYLPYFARNGS